MTDESNRDRQLARLSTGKRDLGPKPDAWNLVDARPPVSRRVSVAIIAFCLLDLMIIVLAAVDPISTFVLLLVGPVTIGAEVIIVVLLHVGGRILRRIRNGKLA